MKKENNENSKIIIYKTSKSKGELKVFLDKETIFLTQQQVAFLFDVQKPADRKSTRLNSSHRT